MRIDNTHLVFDMQRRDSSTGVLSYGTGSHDGSAVASISIRDQRHARVQRGQHLGVAAHVIQRCETEIRPSLALTLMCLRLSFHIGQLGFLKNDR